MTTKLSINCPSESSLSMLTTTTTRRPLMTMIPEADDRIPCIAVPKDDTLPALTNPRLLLPSDFTASQLVHAIRKRITLQPSQAIFVLNDDRMVSGPTSLRELLNRQQDNDDGVLRVTYALENVFG